MPLRHSSTESPLTIDGLEVVRFSCFHISFVKSFWDIAFHVFRNYPLHPIIKSAVHNKAIFTGYGYFFHEFIVISYVIHCTDNIKLHENNVIKYLSLGFLKGVFIFAVMKDRPYQGYPVVLGKVISHVSKRIKVLIHILMDSVPEMNIRSIPPVDYSVSMNFMQ